MVKISWSQLALDDLKNIHAYIALDSQYYATNFIEKLVKKIKLLEKYPSSGRIVPEFENAEIRELIEGKYRIVYKLGESEVTILRIQNFAKLFIEI
ncbi:MAG: type II toxin-antitoxin system RelE/ParE family toxin [Saprospiraceae bacterium]